MRSAGIASLLTLLVAAAPAAAADRTIALSPATPSVKWTGTQASGVFVAFYGFVGEPCTKAPLMYCDETLFEIEFPEDLGNASLTIGPLGNGTDDFDAYLYRINPDGSVGEQVKYSNNVGPGYESIGWNIARGGAVDSDRWLLKVPYYAVDNAAYTSTVTAHGIEPPPAEEEPQDPPPPVDTGPQEPPPKDPPEDDPPKDEPPKDEPEKETSKSEQPDPASPAPTPPPAAQTSAPSPATTPAPAAPRAERPRLRIVRRTPRAATVELTCPATCAATLRAARRSWRFTVAAGDTRELTIPARRAARIRATVRPRRGGRAQILRAG